MVKNKNFINSLLNAINGIIIAFKDERNIQYDVIIACIVIVLGFVFHLNRTEFIIIIFAISFVLVSEYFNSALEKTCDYACNENFSPVIKMAKDISAAAVLISALNSVVIGSLIFLPKIIKFISLTHRN